MGRFVTSGHETFTLTLHAFLQIANINKAMKKVFIVIAVVTLVISTMASCTSSRKGRYGACPMSSGIIH